MFNMGFMKKDLVKRKRNLPEQQMMSQVKKILEKKDQGLILMAKV